MADGEEARQEAAAGEAPPAGEEPGEGEGGEPGPPSTQGCAPAPDSPPPEAGEPPPPPRSLSRHAQVAPGAGARARGPGARGGAGRSRAGWRPRDPDREPRGAAEAAGVVTDAPGVGTWTCCRRRRGRCR